MTIREAFDTINPTIEQKNRIYERLSQNAYAQSGIKRQMIRYVSAAAALVAVTGAAAAGAVFALYNNNGSPINVSLEGSNAPETPYYTAQTTLVSTSSDSSRETPSTTPGETVPPTSVTTAETKSQPETTSEPETLPKPDINDIKAAIITDKTFWSQFGSISYDDKTISLSDDFDTLKLCTDESIGQQIIDRVNSQWAFNGKVNFTSGYEAIKGGKELYNATDEEIEQAIEISQAKEFLDTKEGRLEFKILQGGKNLSGGQRQRLTIARAIVRKPQILILDDSASALDFATDAKLRRAIREMAEDTTVFVVSQRTSSIQYADQIIVMDDGKVAGIGTHESLLAENEVYQEIYYSQYEKKGEGENHEK